MAETEQFATFYLDDLFLGVEVRQVQEVIRFQEMTRVPLAPPVVQGLINLRGQIVTAIDLRRRLALPPRAEGQLPMNVVVRTGEGAVSLLVDEIGDVLEVSADAFESPPETVAGVARELILGVYKLKEALMLVLDTEKSVQIAGSGDAGSAGVAVPSDIAARPVASRAQPLYDRLGGAPAVAAAVEALYERILADAELAAVFRRTDMARLKQKQVEFLSQAFGGPATYSGPSLKQSHAAMRVTARQFDRVAEHLAAALQSLGVAGPISQEVLDLVATLKSDIVSAGAHA
jgi:purine-binding chemotaxis protein CheW